MRRFGWLLIVIWVLGAGGLALQSFVASQDPLFEKLLIVLLIGGPVLLFLSVLLDRVKALKTDRYKGVEK